MDLARDLEEPALNAAPFAQLRLLDLQALDSRLDLLAHRRRSLPEHAELEKIEARLAELRDLLVAAETEEGDVAREQAKAEGDVEQVRARARRDQERLDSGRVGSAKELQNLQHELGSLGRRQSDLEDTVLEIMERREAAQERVSQLAAERDGLLAERQTLSGRRDAAVADIDAESEQLSGQRSAMAGEIPADLMALYDKLRGQMGGVGAAALRQGRCEGCRLQLTSTELSRISTAPDNAVLRCEECRRILVRTAESGV